MTSALGTAECSRSTIEPMKAETVLIYWRNVGLVRKRGVDVAAKVR